MYTFDSDSFSEMPCPSSKIDFIFFLFGSALEEKNGEREREREREKCQTNMRWGDFCGIYIFDIFWAFSEALMV
jgi:hypothetical protein